MSSAPLLGSGKHNDNGGAITADGQERRAAPIGGQRWQPSSWLRRAVDTEEAWAQLQFAVPMILTSMSYYGIPLVSVMFAGHLGDVHLAGATLGNSWATVTGYALLWTSLVDQIRPIQSQQELFYQE